MNAPSSTPASPWQHLHRFAQSGCEDSFRALFESHAGLVYQAALRTGHGNHDLAEEVVQTVFTSLARKAHTLSPRIILPAWLHRHACLTARQMLRSLRRRQAREEAAALLHALDSANTTGIAEKIDEAFDSLPASDREALALRYLENQNLRAVGRLLGVSDDAAQKRVSRGLERLRIALARRGVNASVALAGNCLANSAGAAVPRASSLASAVWRSATAAASPVSGAGWFTFLTMKTSTIVAASITVLAGAVAIPLLRNSPPGPVAVAASGGAVTPPAPQPAHTPGKPSARARTAISVNKGTHFPATPQQSKPSPQYPPEIKEAYLNHPMTKAAEKRVNDMKSVARSLLERMAKSHRETVIQFQSFDAQSKDPAIPETERAAAKAKAEAVTAEAKQMDQDMTDFKREMEAMLQRNVLESKRLILAEIQNPSPPARRPTPEEITAFNTAESQFLKGDYATAERDFALLASSAPPEVATNAQWKVLLSRMVQGTDHNEQIQPLLQGSTSAACYAMAAHYIQQGGWDEANLWIAKARESGAPAENRLFDDPLQEMGWLDPKTGQLIPPDTSASPGN